MNSDIVRIPSSPVLSFEEQLQQVRENVQIEECVDAAGKIELIYNELCLIITEVLRIPYQDKIKISREWHEAYDVQAIYRKITCEHLQLVAENFKAIDYPIKNKKAYLRTALYNSVFELESCMHNDLKAAGVI